MKSKLNKFSIQLHYQIIETPSETSARAPDVSSGHVGFEATHGMSPQVMNVNSNHAVLIPPKETSSRAPEVNNGHWNAIMHVKRQQQQRWS